MEAPYRESAAERGNVARPMRVLVREYRWPGNPRVLWATVPFFGIVIWEVWKIFSTPEASRSETGFSMLMTLGLMAVSILYIAHRAYGGSSDAVRVFDDGVTMARDGADTDIRWDDVATLVSDAFRDDSGRLGQRHVLTGARGNAIVVTHELSDVEALVVELRERVLARALPAAMLAFRAGTPQSFGRARVEPRGLWWAEHGLVPWAEIGRAEAVHGAVTVRHSEGIERFDRVPNADVLVALVEHARAVRS